MSESWEIGVVRVAEVSHDGREVIKERRVDVSAARHVCFLRGFDPSTHRCPCCEQERELRQELEQELRKEQP